MTSHRPDLGQLDSLVKDAGDYIRWLEDQVARLEREVYDYRLLTERTAHVQLY